MTKKQNITRLTTMIVVLLGLTAFLYFGMYGVRDLIRGRKDDRKQAALVCRDREATKVIVKAVNGRHLTLCVNDEVGSVSVPVQPAF